MRRSAVWVVALALVLLGTGALGAATMYSTKDSYMGPGKFWGPGVIDEVPIFDVMIPNIGFSTASNFVTPFTNNGGAVPNTCGEIESGRTPTGTLSDGVTKINEAVNTCSFELNGIRIMAAVVDGGPHQGRQIATTMHDGSMLMTMDFALDMGIGKSGIFILPFYGTTNEVTIPYSIQTQLGIEGGVDRAGTLPSGSKIRGRLGDYNNDGMLDGAIVVAGTMPLDSIFMPGSPYALIRYFDTDIPYDGKMLGKLPGERPTEEPPVFRAKGPATDLSVPKVAPPATVKGLGERR